MPRKCSGNPIGRPKSFCEKRALEAAVRVFAKKGYEDASLSDLTSAMGINRFSMYASFGNKEALYVKAMEFFNQGRRDRVVACLAGKSAREGVDQLLRSVVALVTDAEHGVCFITQAPLSAEAVSPETRRLLVKRRTEVEQALRQRFELAIVDGELTPDASAADLAAYYAVLMQGFALQAQHGGKRDELLRVVELAMSQWPESTKRRNVRSA